LELADRLPAILATLTRLPQLMIHGDASPQHLLVPADQPDTFVVIDWTVGGVAAVGDDLGQLLVGLAHAGLLQAAELPALRDIIIRSYTAGLADEDMGCDESLVRLGMDGGLVLRSAFTALPLERLKEPVTDGLVELVRSRVRLMRYLVDLGLELDLGPALPTDAP